MQARKYRLYGMCRLNEFPDEIYPAFRNEDGGPNEFLDFGFVEEESNVHVPHQQHHLPIFRQSFINESQMAFLIIKRQLMLLIHSNYCSKIDDMFPDRPQCNLRNCDTFKRVLDHLKTCNSLNCDSPRCFSSRNILRHYCNCFNIDCHICF